MFTRDYVMRQIHQLGQVLALILFKKRENPDIEINQDISIGLQDALGVTLDELLGMDEQETVALCTKEGRFQNDFAVSVADLLMQDESPEALERAKWLYGAALKEGGTLPMHALEWLSTTGKSV